MPQNLIYDQFSIMCELCALSFVIRNTSGVLLLTRHTEAARKLAELFKNRRIIKKYW